ncbi:MAG: glycine cleavage system protein H [candidate division Zixibacteria bacterium]|nr:glycine cleavage system protein H [candidate division Zixibacteria bacterium]
MKEENHRTVETEGKWNKDDCIWKSSGAVSLQTCKSHPDCEGCPVETSLAKIASHKQRHFFSRDFFDQCYVKACAIQNPPCPFAGPCMANWSRTNPATSRVLTMMGIGSLSVGANASLVQQVARRNGLYVDLLSQLYKLRNLGKISPDEKLTPDVLNLHTVEEQFMLVASALFLDCPELLDLRAFAKSIFEKGLLPHGLLNSVSKERTQDELQNAFRAIQGLAILNVIPTFDTNALVKLHDDIATTHYFSMATAQMALTVQRILQSHTYKSVSLRNETIERAVTLTSFAKGLLGKMYNGLSITPSELASAVSVGRVLKVVPEDVALGAGQVLLNEILRLDDIGTLNMADAQPILTGVVASGLVLMPSERTLISKAVLRSFQGQFKKLGDMYADPASLLAIMGSDNLVRNADWFEALAYAEVPEEEEELDPALLGCEMPSDLFYSHGHSWVRSEKDDSVRIGLDDLVAHLIGSIDGVEMPKPGKKLRQGEPALRLIRDGELVEMCSPMDGEVIMVNQSVVDTPRVLSDKPYNDGWLLTIRPRIDEHNLSELMFGKNAHNWQRNEVTRLSEMFQDEIATAADGATLAHDALAGIPGVRWSNVLNKFLRG